MSEEERKAWEAGRYGSGPPPSGGSQLDAWQQGNALRQLDAHQRQQSAGDGGSTFLPAFPTFPAAPTGGPAIPSGSTPIPTGDAATGGGLGCLLAPLLLVAAAAAWKSLLPLWVCLYPFSSLATVASGFGAYMGLRQVVPGTPGPLNTDALVWALPVALVVFVVTSRLEHRLARHATYRASRHVVRLGLFGFATAMLLMSHGARTLVPLGRAHLRGLLDNPVQIAAILGVVVAMHFLLWTDNRIRRAWRGVLETLRLRAREV